MTARKARLWLAAIILAALTLFGALASGTDTGGIMLLPGALVAWPVWPEGIHTRAGPASAVGFYVVYVIGNFVIWSLLFRFVLGLFYRPKGNREPVRPSS
jgi:hypothetical protein